MRFYINGPSDRGDGLYSLLHESGEVLASHYCSHVGFAGGDLILHRPERKEEWEARFGTLEPIELEWLGDVPQEERDGLLRRNHQLHEEYLATLEPCNGNCTDRVHDGHCPRHGTNPQVRAVTTD